MKNEDKYWVYILECENGNYYTGYTNNLIRRYHLHLAGKGGKYTRSFRPVKLLKSWVFEDKTDAMKFERHVKSLKREEKESLVQ